MTTSIRLLFRLTMFAVAAIVLAFAFSGMAFAAPGGDDTVSPTPHTHQPVYTLPPGWEPAAPEGEPEEPAEPPPDPEEPASPEPKPTEAQPTEPATPTPTQPPTSEPTSEPASQPFATPAATTSSVPPNTETPAASQPANTGAVRVAIGAGLAAVLLGGGWLATSLARVIRRERHP